MKSSKKYRGSSQKESTPSTSQQDNGQSQLTRGLTLYLFDRILDTELCSALSKELKVNADFTVSEHTVTGKSHRRTIPVHDI